MLRYAMHGFFKFINLQDALLLTAHDYKLIYNWSNFGIPYVAPRSLVKLFNFLSLFEIFTLTIFMYLYYLVLKIGNVVCSFTD